ncbi:MAG TPA: O-antigen ligase family protein [Chloroflexia bacterium]|jgi:O-antigen ligase
MAQTLTQNQTLSTTPSNEAKGLNFRPYLIWLGAVLLAVMVGVVPPLVSVGILVGVAVTAVILRRPVFGAYALVLSVPVQDRVPLPASLTVTQILFALVAGIWYAWTMLRENRRVLVTPIAIAMLLFIVAIVPSISGATSIPDSLAEISRWVVTAFSYIILVNAVQTRREMVGLIVVMLVAGMSEALLGLVQAYVGIGPASFNVEGGLTRAYGTIGMPNSFAGYLNMSLPLALALAVYQWGRWFGERSRTPILDRPGLVTFKRLRLPLFLTFVTLVLFWTVVTTLSRGAWIGLVFGLLAMVVVLGRRAAPALSLMFATAAVTVVLAVAGALPEAIRDRFGQLFTQIAIFDPRGVTPNPDNYALVERMVHWHVAGNMFLSNPWTGAGIGNFNAVFNTFGVQGWPYSRGHAHNYYLHMLGETGLIGFTFYMVMVLTILVVGVRAVRRCRQAGDSFGEAVSIGALGVAVTLAGHSFFENLHALNMGIQWGAALALFTLVGLRHNDVATDTPGVPTSVHRRDAESAEGTLRKRRVHSG